MFLRNLCDHAPNNDAEWHKCDQCNRDLDAPIDAGRSDPTGQVGAERCGHHFVEELAVVIRAQQARDGSRKGDGKEQDRVDGRADQG